MRYYKVGISFDGYQEGIVEAEDHEDAAAVLAWMEDQGLDVPFFDANAAELDWHLDDDIEEIDANTPLPCPWCGTLTLPADLVLYKCGSCRKVPVH